MNSLKYVIAQFYSPRTVWLITVVALMALSLVGMAMEVDSCGPAAC